MIHLKRVGVKNKKKPRPQLPEWEISARGSEYECYQLTDHRKHVGELISYMESRGFEVMNITGGTSWEDVIWFRKRKASEDGRKSVKKIMDAELAQIKSCRGEAAWRAAWGVRVAGSVLSKLGHMTREQAIEYQEKAENLARERTP